MKTFLQFLNEKTYTSTMTFSKMAVIDNENRFIKKIINSRKDTEQMVGVVGDAKTGLKRHIKQYTDLGYQPKNIYVFELLHQEYKNLLYHNSLLKDKINIVKGDIFKPKLSVKKPNFNNQLVTHVDADVTTGLHSSLKDEIVSTLDNYPNLKSAVFVHSLRTPYLHSRTNFNKIDFFVILSKFAKIAYPNRRTSASALSALRNIFEYYIHGNTSKNAIFDDVFKNFPEYSFLVQGYRGKGPMVSITMVKTTGERVIKSNVEAVPRSNLQLYKNLYEHWLSYNYKELSQMLNITKKQFTDVNSVLAVVEADVVNKLQRLNS